MSANKFIIASREGIEIFTFKNSKIDIINKIAFADFDYKTNAIYTICANDTEIWLGSRSYGVYRYALTDKSWTHLHTKNSNLINNEVRKIYQDKLGKIWVGTLSGLSIYESGQKFKNYHNADGTAKSLSNNNIFDIFEDRQNTVWIATYFGGLNYVLPQNSRLEHISTSSPIGQRLFSNSTIGLLDFDDAYWIGTEDAGINILDKKTKKIIQ